VACGARRSRDYYSTSAHVRVSDTASPGCAVPRVLSARIRRSRCLGVGARGEPPYLWHVAISLLTYRALWLNLFGHRLVRDLHVVAS